jgi:hypothetical protein
VVQQLAIGKDTDGLWRQALLPDCRIAAGSDSVTIYLNTIGASGTVWFDDVELKLDSTLKQ